MERVWGFFDKINDNIGIISAIMGIFGFALFKPRQPDEGFRISFKDFKFKAKCVILSPICIFIALCIYCNGLVVVPQIDNTSYEIAQVMLEERKIEYEIINISEYPNILLEDAYVCLYNCEPEQHIKKDKLVQLVIVDVEIGR